MREVTPERAVLTLPHLTHLAQISGKISGMLVGKRHHGLRFLRFIYPKKEDGRKTIKIFIRCRDAIFVIYVMRIQTRSAGRVSDRISLTMIVPTVTVAMQLLIPTSKLIHPIETGA